MQNIPFSTLRAFEAAARHQSFSKAAAELNLTDSAVSHQLKRLEAALQTRLFAKSGRGIILTDAGEVFARSVRDALNSIMATASTMKELGGPGGRLTVACPPMFASKWLARHLVDFIKKHPNIECNIRLIDNAGLAAAKDFDVGIWFGADEISPRWSKLLRRITLTPGISSQLYAHSGALLHEPSDLSQTILLHRDDGTEWRRWFNSAGLGYPLDGQRHLYCNDMSVAIDLALEGVGVALVSDVLSLSAVHRGSLVRPFSHKTESDGAWHAVCDRYQLERTGVRAFLRWLFGCFGEAISFEEAQAPLPGKRPQAGRALARPDA